ncbi:MAG: amidohydrolase family protein [Desulfosarcina sp.]|nr:amidohydrolase family protein [Desulfobacterales bacterium]
METIGGIVAGWLADGSGRPLERERMVEIRDGRIHCIRPVDGADYRGPGIIDWSDGMVIPGLIDSHVHLFMSGTPDPTVRKRQLDAPFSDLKAAMARHIRQHLNAGVVAVRDGGDYGGHALHYRETCFDTGQTPIEIRVAGKAWRMQGRYGRLIGRPAPAGEGLAGAIRNCTDGIDHVKMVNSGLNSLRVFGKQTRPQFKLNALAGAVQAATARGWPVMVHANGETPVREAIMAGCRSIEHGFFMGRDGLERLAEGAVSWVPTACTMKGYVDHSDAGSIENAISMRNLDHQLEQLRQARSLGVDVVVGTDAGTIGVHHGWSLKDEMALLMEAGFSLAETVRCASLNGARLLGLTDLGVLAPGRQATMVALEGGPAHFPGNLDPPGMLLSAGRVIFNHAF